MMMNVNASVIRNENGEFSYIHDQTVGLHCSCCSENINDHIFLQLCNDLFKFSFAERDLLLIFIICMHCLLHDIILRMLP